MKIQVRVNGPKAVIVVRNVSLRDTLNQVLFTPYPGKRFIVRMVTVIADTITGTVSTPPQYKITNSVNDIVAAGAIAPTTQGAALVNTVVVGNNVVENLKPLLLDKTVAAVGGTAFKADLIIEGQIY